MGLKILVTGAAGFIGAALSQRLLVRGDEVIGVDNLNHYYDVRLKLARLKRLNSHASFRFCRVDIADSSGVEQVFSEHRPQRVVNLAAQAGVRYSLTNPHAYIDSNIKGFLNILEGCRHHGVESLSYASSSSVYGANENMPFSELGTADHPVALYGATKRANELMAHSYSHLYRIPTTGLRFFSVYGPWGRPDLALFLFVKRILEGQPIDVFNHGDHKRDFTFVDDIVEGVVRVIDNPARPDSSWNPRAPSLGSSRAPFRIYNIGNSNQVTLEELIESIELALGRKAEKRYLPAQPGDVRETLADISALESDFGFRPQTKLQDGVRLFVRWYLDDYLPLLQTESLEAEVLEPEVPYMGRASIPSNLENELTTN